MNTRAKTQDFLAGGGEMGALIRAYDWSRHPLGAPEAWPQTLRTTLRLLLNTGHPMYIFWGPELYCFYNDAYRQSIGPERHPSSLGKAGREVWDEIWTIIGPDIEQVMAGRGATWHENALVPITRHGQREDVYWTYSYGPIDDEAAVNGVGGVLVVCTETTAQVEGGRRLSASEERLQLALSGGRGIGAWNWDIARDRVVADAAFANLYGVDPEYAQQGAPIARFFVNIHHDDVERVERAVDEALRAGAPFKQEYRLVQADGGVRWVSAEGRCVLDRNGAPVRFPGISFDITDRKCAEERREALVALTDRIRDIDDSADLIFAACEILGETLNVSRVSYGAVDPNTETYESDNDWLGSGVRALQGRVNLRDFGSFIEDLKRGELVAIDDVRTDPRTIKTIEALKDRGVGAFVNVPVMERGALVAIISVVSAKPRHWNADDLALIEDIAARTRTATERLRAAHALAQANERLETAVAQRTLELTAASEALRQSQKMEAIGQLTGGIAHDFNNMLAVVIGALNLMKRRLDRGDSDVGKYADAAMDGANRAASLTKRLLAFSRQQKLAPEALDANRLVAAMTDLLGRTLGEQIRIETHLADDLGTIHADPSQLESALLNLAVNARDAMPGGGSLSIETENISIGEEAARVSEIEAGSYVAISVTDTGEGMDEATLAHVFEPFFTTKAVGQGTGLGLSQVFGFVRQSGGYVKIQSAPNAGTKVKLYLPRVFGEARAPLSQAERQSAPGARAGEVVLVVEDEARVRAFSEEALHELGYGVFSAAGGPEALDLIDAHPEITVLFTDVIMPDMTGRRLAEAALSKRPDLKIVFTTGYARDVVVSGAVLQAHEVELLKPFTIEQLARKLRAVLDAP